MDDAEGLIVLALLMSTLPFYPSRRSGLAFEAIPSLKLLRRSSVAQFLIERLPAVLIGGAPRAIRACSPSSLIAENPMFSSLPSLKVESHTKGDGRRKPHQGIKVTFPLTDEDKEKHMKIIDGM